MKLTGLHIFLILLGSIVLCPLLKGATTEGMTSSRKSKQGYGRRHRGGSIRPGGYPYSANHGSPSPTYSGGSFPRDGGGGWGGPPQGAIGPSGSYTPPQPASGSPPPQVNITTQPASSALPAGIPRHEIASGDEDLYILKSSVVPPVCPACPTRTACPRQEPCPPCPPCGRCPEPAFECQKVPNYRSNNSDFLPRPVLSDFSQFGM